MKKTIIFALCAVLMFSVPYAFSSCADSGKEDENGTESSTEKAPEPQVTVKTSTEYVYIAEASGGYRECSVDVTKMKHYKAGSDYRVTAVYEDGTYFQETVKVSDGGTVDCTFEKPVTAIEISPVFKFSLGNAKGSESNGYIKVSASEKYKKDADYGFKGNAKAVSGGIDLVNASTAFVVSLPDGMYDVTVTKTDSNRSNLYINGNVFAINVGFSGQGRTGAADLEYTSRDIVVDGGKASFTMNGKTFSFAKIEFAKAAEIIPRKTHIYIGGDSTVETNYPRFLKKEPADGTARTGWGQLFEYYVTDDVIVDPLGAGGTYAKSWYDSYFKGVMANAKPGDYFIIQAGINDRSYSNDTEMTNYLKRMITECKKNGVIPVLVTSQHTAKFWGANGEYGLPTGSGLAGYITAIRNLAKKEKTLFVDIAELTAEWYSTVGRTYVERTYHLYDSATKSVVDNLHSSYAGSKKIAELVATDIASQIKEGVTDKDGNTFDGIKLNPIIEYEFEYKNKRGKTETVTVSAVEYELYK